VKYALGCRVCRSAHINIDANRRWVTRTGVEARNAAARAAEYGISVDELQAEAEARIPVGRANAPEDVAAMAVCLASPGACVITGQAYYADGGLVPS
jgi:enoyl-[acyl-carrier-protein] reductase (NADH)